MAAYIKSCAICFKQFRSERIGTMYCSKKCCNKARSFPAKVLEALIEKTNRTLQVVPTVPKAVRDYIKIYNREHGISSDDTSISSAKASLDILSIDSKDKATILEEVALLKLGRNIEFKDNFNFINKTDPAQGSADGFSDSVTGNKENTTNDKDTDSSE